MTPKDKAKELIDKFHNFTYTSVHAYKTSGEYSDTIKCALIAVDEILSMGIMAESGDWNMAKEFWQEVKKEIEKL